MASPKSKSCLTNVMAFYSGVITSNNNRRPTNVIYLDFYSEIDNDVVHSALVAQKANCILGSIRRGVASRQMAHPDYAVSHKEPGQLPTELPYEEQDLQENLSYHTQAQIQCGTTQKRVCSPQEVQVWESLGQPGQMPNISSVSEFLLLAFADTRELQLLHFALFLGIYLAALLGNGLILSAVACHHRLHTPMYFFLLNLALLDVGSISTTLPKAMANALWDTRAISYQGCAAQVFFLVFFFSSEYYLLTVMAYDRYVAICKPLHYGSLLGSRACAQMAAAAWGSGFLNAVLHTATTFSVPLCRGNAVDQFFCEISQILKLSCSDAYLREFGILVFSVFLVLGCFVFIVVSYVRIFRAVLRISSSQGRHKAFSTCLPHMAVISLFVSTATVAYLKPPSISSPSLDLVMAVLYSVVPPAMNPLIYSVRNQELRNALIKTVSIHAF
ncbi:olfactory receptor 14C36-like [Aythya fuligula]|uniref:Olfactory receptor 14C36-like n=1 Tax=Aythya fuligula TaxID=219594 RepID=A0A6J3EHN3_AYTFU|nr:olfactory receptor 14C36-like [Aythya fuligula]